MIEFAVWQSDYQIQRRGSGEVGYPGGRVGGGWWVGKVVDVGGAGRGGLSTHILA